MTPPPPKLSVVVLTLNEQANIGDCLGSLARQAERDFEVIVVDAASTDATIDIVQEMAPTFPVPLRIEAAATQIPIGAARNLGVGLAKAPLVAFLSADAEAEPDWTRRAIRGLESADMVFGRQLHEPRRWTVGASVRGLRYNFPKGGTPQPLRFASNVAAAYRKQVLQANPFDDWANAAEDLLLARRAAEAGARATYDPDFLVRHHDVAEARVEWRKNVREGFGWGAYRAELGLLPQLIGWGVLLAAALTYVVVRPGPASIAVLAISIWLPALRRAARRRPDSPPAGALLLGVAASPVFDLAFLASYVRGLARPAALQETRP